MRDVMRPKNRSHKGTKDVMRPKRGSYKGALVALKICHARMHNAFVLVKGGDLND